MYQVVIAGAGPVGLFLACELSLAGISVLVLERLEDPRTPLKANFMGGRGVNLPSVEAFYRRGMLDDLRAAALAWIDVAQQQGIKTPTYRFAGHFAGITLDANKIDFPDDPYVLKGPSFAGALVSLEALEALLTRRALHLGAEIRYGLQLTGFTQHYQGVTIQAGNETFEAQWLVACDGGRSTVRKLAGFEFVGTDPELTGTIATVELADPEKLLPGWTLSPRGLYVNGPGPGRIGIVEFDGAPAGRDTPVTLEDVQGALRRVSGTDVTITTLHIATRYTDHARQATTYRSGRVLLAGDAAHVHSPFGGQGLNLGIGDAMNLGWKLATTIQGWAPASLLDSYTAERHPIAAWVLDWTRAQIAIMRPTPHAQAMQAVVRELIDTPAGASFFAQKIAGTWLRYNLPGDHPLIGRSAPDFEFEDGTRLGALLNNGKPLLLDFRNTAVKPKDALGLTALLIRPDGFVAWATDNEPAPGVLAEHWGKLSPLPYSDISSPYRTSPSLP